MGGFLREQLLLVSILTAIFICLRLYASWLALLIARLSSTWGVWGC